MVMHAQADGQTGRSEGGKTALTLQVPCQGQLESERPLLKCREAIGKGGAGAGIPVWLKPLHQENQVAPNKQALTSQGEDSSRGRGS